MEGLVGFARSLRVEPRPRQSVRFKVALLLGVLAAALLAGATLLLATGFEPIPALRMMIVGGVRSELALRRTLILATPLILTGLAAALAFKMVIWNIGAEGQLYFGAIGASGVALLFVDGMPPWIAVPVVLAAGALGGGLLALISAVPRAYFGTDEVTSTLMLNFMALFLMNYLVLGSSSLWRDLDRPNFPTGEPIPQVAELPLLWGTGRRGLHIGFALAVIIALGLWAAIRHTPWGFEVRAIGDSPKAARYAGMNVTRKTISVMLLSGGLAGLAGGIEVSGVLRALEPGALSIGLGYTGIVVAALARLNMAAVIPVGFVVAAITNSGQALQTLGIPNSVVVAFHGMLLLAASAAQFFALYQIRVVDRSVSTVALKGDGP
ncbi:MAG: ABC transporter permease [bacterium]|nr:ABC transporter permease [bacterium]